MQISDVAYEESGMIAATIGGVRHSGIHDGHRLRADIAAWEAGGNTIAAYEEPAAPDPLTIPLNRFQFDAMMRILGITSAAIETAIDAAVTDATANAIAKARFHRAETYNRAHPLFDLLAPEVGLTSGEIDTAWATAAAIR